MNDTSAREAFRPAGEHGRGETFLRARKRERKPERILFVSDDEILGAHELGQTLGNVIEELNARAGHDRLRYQEDLRLHLDLARVQVDHEHTKVGAAQVEREHLAVLAAVGQRAHVRGKHFYVSDRMRGRVETAMHLLQHERHYFLQMFFRQLELAQ